MSFIDMCRPLLFVLLASVASTALSAARADSLGSVPIFACGTGEDASQGMLKLHGGTTEDGSVEAIQFIEVDGDIETNPRPKTGTEGREVMLFSNSHGPEGYFFLVRWSNEGRTFALYSNVKPKNADGIAESNAGLVVLDALGRVEREHPCAERPSVYLDLLSEGTRCDEQNPLGVAACDLFNPPMRTTALTALYPWMPAE